MLEVLFFDSDPERRAPVERALRDEGHGVHFAADATTAADRLRRKAFDVIVCDLDLGGGRPESLAFLRTIRGHWSGADVLVAIAPADLGHVTATLVEGACDYLVKPVDVTPLLARLRRLDEARALRREVEKLRGELTGRITPAALVGESSATRRLVELAKAIAPSEGPVLVMGEKGTGKEIVARLIHDLGPRRARPFVVVNCAAVAESSIDAELAGHARGAFAGAVHKRDGWFKVADGGVLFLDEIDELPLPAQDRLLRALREGTYEPLGTSESHPIDVRVIASTHRNLAAAIKAGAFREELWHWLETIQVMVPPLRDHPDDVPVLVRHFIRRSLPMGAPAPRVSSSAWAALAHYAFPGNVRELAHAVEHALVLSGGAEIDREHLPSNMACADGGASPGGPSPSAIRPLTVALREFEQQYLQRALKEAGNKRTRAAELLGISRKTLWEKLRAGGQTDADFDGPEDPES